MKKSQLKQLIKEVLSENNNIDLDSYIKSVTLARNIIGKIWFKSATSINPLKSKSDVVELKHLYDDLEKLIKYLNNNKS